ncbi:protein TonB [Idiomarina tyrosinivorans]|uniref:Protein TonB n=2 Tax=Idiomarina tyrosinivorans TaxID=1445662 RepID=A0A432ZSH5_9GAMM|nr:protein TonB [Idiomarina tyrosinivorans]
MMRFFYALLAAAAMTIGLYYLMQSLITGGEGAFSEPPRGSVLDFVRVKQQEQVQQKERKPERPPEPKEPPPEMPQPQMSESVDDSASAAMDFSADISSAADLGNGLSLQSSDGEYLPIVKVQAMYPRRALQRGIEGYVLVEFTVTPQGSVTNPHVVKAEPEGIFEQAAMDAVLKFKYKPRVVNGEPVAVEGVQNRITFEMSG